MTVLLPKRLTVGEGRIGRVLFAFMALGFTALVGAVVAAALLTDRNEVHTRWVNHTYEVGLAIGRASVGIERGETARRGYLLTRQAAYLETYRIAAVATQRALDQIGRLTIDNPNQRRNIARLRAEVADMMRQRQTTIAFVEAGARGEALAMFATESRVRRMVRIRALAAAMAAEEQRLLILRDAAQRASVRNFYAVLGVAGALLVLVAILSLTTVLRYTDDLARSRDALRDFADNLEDQVATRTADLALANEEIQRFAYIVSHDLRSPLVNVMGFTAELATATAPLTTLIERAEAEAPQIVTEEARLAVREDLPEAIGFIRTSTQKMDRLINAILKLSREGRRTIAPEPIDLHALITGIVASMQHTVDGRGATIDIDTSLPALTSDRLAIEQILSNLIENATKYLQPGRPGHIAISGSAVGGRVVIAVADNGRGIDARDHMRVFDLFRRSGAQDQPGEGIGLAHVRALAYRLGGTISVSSVLGEGATFRVDLPRTLLARESHP